MLKSTGRVQLRTGKVGQMLSGVTAVGKQLWTGFGHQWGAWAVLSLQCALISWELNSLEEETEKPVPSAVDARLRRWVLCPEQAMGGYERRNLLVLSVILGVTARELSRKV